MDYEIAGLVLLAAAIATLVRLEDWPPTEWTMDEIKNILGTFLGVAIVTVFAAWYLAESQGIYVDTIEGMLAIVMVAVGGVATIRAILSQATKVIVPPTEDE